MPHGSIVTSINRHPLRDFCLVPCLTYHLYAHDLKSFSLADTSVFVPSWNIQRLPATCPWLSDRPANLNTTTGQHRLPCCSVPISGDRPHPLAVPADVSVLTHLSHSIHWSQTADMTVRLQTATSRPSSRCLLKCHLLVIPHWSPYLKLLLPPHHAPTQGTPDFLSLLITT